MMTLPKIPMNWRLQLTRMGLVMAIVNIVLCYGGYV